jgi:hypothetical protein
MELNGWTSPQMLRRYGASARSARARRGYDCIMDDAPLPEPAGSRRFSIPPRRNIRGSARLGEHPTLPSWRIQNNPFWIMRIEATDRSRIRQPRPVLLMPW